MISPLAFIDPSAKIGEGVTVHPFAFIDKDVVVGDRCEIFPYASLMAGTRLGADCRVFQSAVVGAEPQDFRYKGCNSLCEIADRVTIREQAIVNRSIHEGGATRIGPDTFIMANAHVGHDTVIEGKAVLGNGAIVAGDCRLGKCVIMSSNSVLHEKSRVAEWVMIKGGCRVSGNVPPYVMRKNGFNDKQIDDIAKAYRNIYQSGISVFNALRRIEADLDPSEIRDNIMNFITNVKLKIVAVPVDMED